MKEALGGYEYAVGERQGQGRFRKPVVAHPWNRRKQRPAGKQSQYTAADEGQEEFVESRSDVRFPCANDHLEQDREQSNGGRVIEQRLAFDEACQARRGTEIAKDRDDRRGIGGRDDGTEQQADHQWGRPRTARAPNRSPRS